MQYRGTWFVVSTDKAPPRPMSLNRSAHRDLDAAFESARVGNEEAQRMRGRKKTRYVVWRFEDEVLKGIIEARGALSP